MQSKGTALFRLLKKRTIILFLVAVLALCTSCQTVKPYQRVYLNDDNMQAGKQPVKTFGGHVHNYREGATGGGESKGSGGCGCN